MVTAPMPSMPVGFWGDPTGRRFRDAYFSRFPGVWCHGDWITITDGGSCVIYRPLDATLNRGGVRLGTSEFYAVVEDVPGVADSLVVHLEDAEGGAGRLVLFVQPDPGAVLDDDLVARSPPTSARRSPRATCPTRSTPCRPSPAPTRVRSWRCR